MATGLIGEAALPLVFNGSIITHERSTESLASKSSFKFSMVCIPT